MCSFLEIPDFYRHTTSTNCVTDAVFCVKAIPHSGISLYFEIMPVSKEFIHIRSISQFHEFGGLPKPDHPLISVINAADLEINEEWVGQKFIFDLYTIAVKDKSCAMEYGRNTYDFNEGVMVFTAPGQVVGSQQAQKKNEVQGWMLLFHPDLVRNSELGKNMDHFGFFSYEVHEALHLSETEQDAVNRCVQLIEQEIKARIDLHSQRVIVSGLELLLNYSLRFYERQFHTRTAVNLDIISRFERHLGEYYRSGELSNTGIPSIEFFAGKEHLSANYFSDLIKKHSGQSAKDHINSFLVEKAKSLLLSGDESISQIAYTLGFNYPHYFSRLFKVKTGVTPNEYRSGLSMS